MFLWWVIMFRTILLMREKFYTALPAFLEIIFREGYIQRPVHVVFHLAVGLGRLIKGLGGRFSDRDKVALSAPIREEQPMKNPLGSQCSC